ncbi:MAG TPA: alpha/beta hydrolase family protein [Gammaproteobacteria bacterium]|nr:alpha/beta hydrolase family protein [Gammaproteobacteria bacterium]
MDHEMARRPEPWLMAVAGVAWIACGADGGLLALILAALPGALLLAAGTGTLLFPGDRLVPRAGATGALVGLIFAVPLLFIAPGEALLLGALSAAAGLASGRLAAEDLVPPPGREVPEMSVPLAAEIALDEAVLGSLTTVIGVYSRPVQPRVGVELVQTLEWLEDGGWLKSPASFHRAPPPIGPVSLASRRIAGLDCELMRFDSDFEPREDAPGRDRWLGYRNNRKSEVRVVRSPGSRDWLVCVHGLAMGHAWLDMRAMGAAWLHSRGVNLAFPVLPLHGPRANGKASGEGFLAGDVSNTLHALTQTAWDIRRLLAWLRDEGAERVGITGLSLGGYSTALVASLEDNLECAIAGIPAAEFGELTCYHASGRALALAAQENITPERISRALIPVSPLAMTPRIAREQRFIYGALADRFVPPAQVDMLWRHWQEPEIEWYPGGHLGFRFHPPVRSFIDRALRATVLRER